jgi:hypothetical protein
MLLLLGSGASFLLWVLVVFVRPIGLGIAHLLLGLSGVLIIRWWALREETGPVRPAPSPRPPG